MVVIYVPEDKRWEKLGQGLGGLLGTFVEAKFKHSMADDISQMSQDPKYANNPQQLYMDAEAKYPGFGGSMYLKSMDAGLKTAQIKEIGQRHGLDDLRAIRLQQQIDAENDPVKKAEMQARLDNYLLRNQALRDVAPYAAPTAAARAGSAKETLYEKRARRQAGEGSQKDFNDRFTMPGQGVTNPAVPVGPPSSSGGGVESEGEGDGGGDEPGPQGALGPSGAAGALARTFPEEQEQISTVTGMPIPPPPVTLGPPEHPLQAAEGRRPGGRLGGMAPQVMPSLPTSGFVQTGATGPTPVPTAPQGPQTVPMPGGGTAPAQRILAPGAPPGTAPTLTAAPQASDAPPVPTAEQVPRGSTAASQPAPAPTREAPLGLPPPGSPEYEREQATVEANIPQVTRDDLASQGITHPEQQLRAFHAATTVGPAGNWKKAYQAEIDKIKAEQRQEAQTVYKEGGIERRHEDTIRMEQARMKQLDDHFNIQQNRQAVMPPEERKRLDAAETTLAGLASFDPTKSPTGGIGSHIQNFFNQWGIAPDPNFALYRVRGDQLIVGSALSGGGFGGEYRTRNERLINPSAEHYNYVNELQKGAIAGQGMAEMAQMYDQFKVAGQYKASLPNIYNVYLKYKEIADEANTLWWIPYKDRQGKPTGDFHYYYKGQEVDRNLQPLRGPTSMPAPDAQYRLKSDPSKVVTGAELSYYARQMDMTPAERMGNDWELVK